MVSTYDILIVCATVIVSLMLPRLPPPIATHAFVRLLVCVLVVVLCVYLPQSMGVPLSLLLVLSTVPVVRLERFVDGAHTSHLPPHTSTDTSTDEHDEHDEHDDMLEAFANAKDKDELLEKFSQQKMGEKAIADKMKVFTRINTKQEEFKQQLANIEKNLKDVREFYANEEEKYQKEIGRS